jgi:hypothetical protein
MSIYRVKWYHVEEFECDIELDKEQARQVAEADEDWREGVLDEKLTEVIVDMDHEALTLAFQGCSDREITERRELEAHEQDER